VLSVGTDRYGAWTGPRGWSLSLLVRWFQWGSFALLLFLWLGMVGEIAGLGRIRLVLGGLLALTFHPREYVAGVNTLLGRRAPRYALLMLVLMVASHWAWGTSDSLIVRNGVTDVAVMLWAVMLVRSSGDMVRFRKVFLGVVSVLALGGLAAFWRGGGGEGRMLVWGDPNVAAVAFCLAVPFSVAVLRTGASRWERVCGGASLALLLMAVLATASRAGFILLALVCFFSLWAWAKSVRTVVWVTLVLGAIGAVVVWVRPGPLEAPLERLETLSEVDLEHIDPESSLYSRVQAQKGALRAWVKHPFVGIGFGNFKYGEGAGWAGDIGAHNSYLQLMAEMGLVGLAVFVGVLWYMYKGYGGAWRRSYGLVVVTFVLASMTLHTIMAWILLFLFAALAGCAEALEEGDSGKRKARLVRRRQDWTG